MHTFAPEQSVAQSAVALMLAQSALVVQVLLQVEPFGPQVEPD